MSPEQFKDPGKVKYYSDYYFIGSVLFYMLTKHTPFSRDRNGTTHAKKIQSYLNKTDFSNKNIYENIVSLVNKLLEYNINDRLINLDEIEDYIDKIISLL